MFCPVCGREISDQAKFCPFCGAVTTAPQPQPEASAGEALGSDKTVPIMPWMAQDDPDGETVMISGNGYGPQNQGVQPVGYGPQNQGVQPVGYGPQNQGVQPVGYGPQNQGVQPVGYGPQNQGVQPVGYGPQNQGVQPVENEPSDPKASGKNKNGKKKSPLPIILVAVLIGILVGVAALIFVLKPAPFFSSEETSKETDETTEPPTTEPPTTEPPTTEPPTMEPPTTELEPVAQQMEPLSRPMNLASFGQAVVADAVDSSGPDNEEAQANVWRALDGSEFEGWESSDGVGQTLTFTMDREYEMRYMNFKLGNWAIPDGVDQYEDYSRPKTMLITMADQTWEVTFPDERQEQTLEFPLGIKMTEVTFEVTSVYEGRLSDDVCIAEITLYGVDDGLGWQYEDGEWYFYTAPNEYAQDWVELQHQWYYFSNGDGAMMRSKWQQLGDYCFYFQADGRMMKGWLHIDDDYFYLDDEGHMVTGFMPITTESYTWVQSGEISNFGEGYFFDEEGKMYTGDLLVWAQGCDTPQKMQQYAKRNNYYYVELSDEDKEALPYPTSGVKEVFYSFSAEGQYSCYTTR